MGALGIIGGIVGKLVGDYFGNGEFGRSFGAAFGRGFDLRGDPIAQMVNQIFENGIRDAQEKASDDKYIDEGLAEINKYRSKPNV